MHSTLVHSAVAYIKQNVIKWICLGRNWLQWLPVCFLHACILLTLMACPNEICRHFRQPWPQWVCEQTYFRSSNANVPLYKSSCVSDISPLRYLLAATNRYSFVVFTFGFIQQSVLYYELSAARFCSYKIGMQCSVCLLLQSEIICINLQKSSLFRLVNVQYVNMS